MSCRNVLLSFLCFSSYDQTINYLTHNRVSMELMGNNRSNNHLVKSFSLLLIIISMVLGSCVPKSKTIDPLTKSEYSKINSIAVVISANEEFTVMVERIKQSGSWGSSCSSAEGCVFELIIYVIIAVVDSYLDHRSDKKDAEMIQEKLEQFDATEKLSTKLRDNLKSSNTRFNVEIAETNSPSILKARGFDTMLVFNLNEWGFEICPTRQLVQHPEAVRLGEEYKTYIENVKAENKARQKERGNVYGAYQHTKEDKEVYNKYIAERSKYLGANMIISQVKANAKMTDLSNNYIIWERQEVYKDTDCHWLIDIKSNPEILFDILSNAINNLALNTVNEIK